jgi:hypothetical protein
MSGEDLLTLAEVEVLLTTWEYRNPREAVRWWRRKGWIAPVDRTGRPAYRLEDLVETERQVRRSRPGFNANRAARARALQRLASGPSGRVRDTPISQHGWINPGAQAGPTPP